MSGQWKPGDLAMVTWEEPSGRSTIESTERAEFTGAAWVWIGGMIQPEWVSAARPLVVIDPEDAEAVKRLRNALPVEWCLTEDAETRRETFKAVQAALREFANPTPPRPDEPQGLGAVVRDAEGAVYIRTGRVDDFPWQSNVANTLPLTWSIIDAVEVLSEGVTP